MKIDKNTFLGWGLLFLIFVGFFWYNNVQQKNLADQQKKIQDSLAKSIIVNEPSSIQESISNQNNAQIKNQNADTQTKKEILSCLENDKIKIYFTNVGGQIKNVIIKNFINNFNNKDALVLAKKNKFIYNFWESADKINQNVFVYFNPIISTDSLNQVSNLVYTYKTQSGNYIEQVYSLSKNSYNLDFTIRLKSNDGNFLNKEVNFDWYMNCDQVEPGRSYELQQTNFSFVEGDEFDYFSSTKNYTPEQPLKWLSMTQQFFSSTLIFNNSNNLKFKKITFDKSTNDTSVELAMLNAQFSAQISYNKNTEFSFSYLFAPNDLTILTNQGPQISKIINFGRGMYAFVRPINIYVLKPVFDFLANHIASLGICIILLTIFIKIITAPLTYSGYVSSAKMKALKPELDVIKAKSPGDQQAFAMEQMKLFREAGVNPLSGCVPALLIIPIFASLFNFFNANIILRGKSFLWANDLSSYDNVYNFGFNIPFYGDHFSLFTFLTALTTFLSTFYNMSATPTTNDNPAFKYMPYIFPVFMLLFFNSTPAALTMYYTVANIFTMVIQLVIQKFIIDHDKIRHKLNEKRKQPKKKSMWQDRYDKMMETQKNVQKLKNQTKKN